MQYCFLLGFTLLIPSFSAFGQKINVLSPSSFLEDSAQAPKFSSAFLVTEGDTLITWQKEFNRTTVAYLNSKITKTVWEDSVEVCKQIGFMLDNFEEWCERKDNAGNKLVTTVKKKRDFYKTVFRDRGTYSFGKSYSEGLRYEEWEDDNGDSFTIHYAKNEIGYYTSVKGEGRWYYDMKDGDTLSFEFSTRDSTYKEKSNKIEYRYKYSSGWAKVTVFDTQRDSSFSVGSETKAYRKCHCDAKYVLYKGRFKLNSGEEGFRMNPECCTEPYVEVQYLYKPEEGVVSEGRVTYPFSKIEYLDENAEVMKTIQVKNKKGTPVKLIIDENGKSETSRIKKRERKKYTISSLEILPIPNAPYILHRSSVDTAFTNGNINLSLRDTSYSLKNWTLKLDNSTGCLDSDSSVFILITQKGVVNWLITNRSELDCFGAFSDSTELTASDLSTWLYFKMPNGKVLQKNAHTVFRVQYKMRTEEYEAKLNK